MVRALSAREDAGVSRHVTCTNILSYGLPVDSTCLEAARTIRYSQFICAFKDLQEKSFAQVGTLFNISHDLNVIFSSSLFLSVFLYLSVPLSV